MIEPVIAEERADALAFLFQLDDAEVLILLQHALLTGGLYEAICLLRILQVGHGVQVVGRAHVDRIVHLGGSRVFLRHFRVGHGAIEITIVMQEVGGHFGARLAIDGRHQHRVGSQMVEYPSAQSLLVLIFHEPVVHPQPYGQGPTQRAASEDGIVRSVGQSRLHLFQCSDSGRRLVLVHDVQLVDTRVEDFAFGQVPGGGASDQAHT